MTVETPRIHNRRVLILDDNEGNRTLLKFVMQLNHIDHIEVENGMSALAAWQTGDFKFAFLDVELPDISGLEVARRIRATDKDIAIIVCTANDDPAIITAAVNAECDIIMIKPFQLDSLMNMTKMMDRASLRATPRVLIVDNTARPRWEARPVRAGRHTPAGTPALPDSRLIL